jgi:hypothetical protein
MTADLTPYAVQVPITDGVRTVNFFNGRLLSAEDLRREQDAGNRLRQRMARAVGDGVVEGLTVRVSAASTATEPIVAVSAGSALNREGTALRLADSVDVSLARTRGSTGPAAGAAADRCDGGDFAPCTGLAPGAPFVHSGVYLLTVRPAEAAVGRAPVSGLGNEAAACNTDTIAEGVSFDVLHLNLEPSLLTDIAHLRNRLAHRVFGTDDPRRSRLERDPFGSPAAGYGLLDDLRPNCLCDDEVPLALILWTPGVGIRFVDMWSVRRRVTRGSPSVEWPELAGDRRRAEGEAMFLQFQEHLEELRVTANSERLEARSHFRFLPAAGLLPLGPSVLVRGFGFREFFAGVPVRGPSFIEGTHAAACLQESFAYEPIELSKEEAIWLYVVRQNQQPVTTGALPVSFVLFTTGHLRYRADARFNLAYWNFASYAEIG